MPRVPRGGRGRAACGMAHAACGALRGRDEEVEVREVLDRLGVDAQIRHRDRLAEVVAAATVEGGVRGEGCRVSGVGGGMAGWQAKGRVAGAVCVGEEGGGGVAGAAPHARSMNHVWSGNSTRLSTLCSDVFSRKKVKKNFCSAAVAPNLRPPRSSSFPLRYRPSGCAAAVGRGGSPEVGSSREGGGGQSGGGSSRVG